MKTNVNEVEINGICYIPKGTARGCDGMEYVIVRTASAGVFAGYLGSRDGNEAVVRNARRIWYWDGAASLSQLSIDGTSKPENCKFPEAVEKVLLLGVIEILYPTEKAQKSIEGVPIWQK